MQMNAFEALKDKYFNFLRPANGTLSPTDQIKAHHQNIFHFFAIAMGYLTRVGIYCFVTSYTFDILFFDTIYHCIMTWALMKDLATRKYHRAVVTLYLLFLGPLMMK